MHCPATRSAGCAGASTCTTCASGSGRTCTPSCASWCAGWAWTTADEFGTAPTAPAEHAGITPATPARRGSLAVEVDRRRVHTRVLAGLLSHVGLRLEPGREYQGARGSRFVIWPGSALARSGPQLVVAAELVETSRLWGRICAAVEPEWVEEVGGAPAAAQLLRAALAGSPGLGRGHREGHAARCHDRRGPHRAVRPDRSRARQGALHPARPGGARLANAAPVPGRQRRRHRAGRGVGEPHPAPRHRCR